MGTAGRRMGMGAGGLLSLLVACVGGPGSGGSPSNRSGQNGAVEPDRSQSSVNDPDREDDDDRDESASSGKTPPPNTQSISAAEFGRGCSTDDDCVAVFEGLVCTVCKCDSVAIAKSDKPRYDSERTKRSSGCTTTTESCQPCAPVRVGCDPTSKQCAVGVTSNDAG